MDGTRFLKFAQALAFFFVFLVWVHSTATDTVSGETMGKAINSIGGIKFVFPCDVAADSRGFFYVLDSQNRTVSVFSTDMNFIKHINLDAEKIRTPEGFDVSLPGMVVIADSGNDSVIECNINGKIIQKWHIPDASRLVDVGIYGKRIFAIDGEKSKVYVITRDQKGYETLGGYGDHPGEFKYPYRMKISGNGRIYISDVLNARVQILDTRGKMIGEIKSFGVSRTAFLRPGGVYSDGSGRIYITDMMSGFVYRSEKETGTVNILRVKGEPLQFSDPVSLAISKGYMGVADQGRGVFYLIRVDDFDN